MTDEWCIRKDLKSSGHDHLEETKEKHLPEYKAWT
jgi:hypothetical protein